MDQVKQYKLPLNPAKTTDSRFATYLAEFGDESWELDALEPTVLDELIRSAVGKLIDKKKWNARQRVESAGHQAFADRGENGLGRLPPVFRDGIGCALLLFPRQHPIIVEKSFCSRTDPGFFI